MRQIDQQDQGFLCGQMLFAPSFEAESHLVGLDFGFAGATVIVVPEDLSLGPFGHRADDSAELDLLGRGQPTQHQVLRGAHIDWGRRCGCHPSAVAQLVPGIFGYVPGKGLWPLAAFAFGQYLPAGLEGPINIGVAAKAGV